MKFVCIADLHLHPYRECSRDNGADRLQDGLRALRQSLAYAQQEEAVWCSLGDLKHLKGMWHQGALNGALTLMEQFKDVPKVFVHGNHDGIAEGTSGLMPFRNYGVVIERPSIIPVGGMFDEKVAIWPHQLTLEHLEQFMRVVRTPPCTRVLLGHAFITGAEVGPAAVRFLEGIALEQFGMGKKDRTFKAAILGDVHKQQRMPPGHVWYCGSPYAQNWGESERGKGFLMYDTKAATVYQIKVNGVPEFWVEEIQTNQDLEGRQWPKGWAAGHFVRLIVPEWVKRNIVEHIQERSEARFFQTITRRNVDVKLRAPIHAGMNHRQLLEEYMKVRSLNGLDPKAVMAAGLQLLKGDE